MSIRKEIIKAKKKFKSWTFKRKFIAENFHNSNRLVLFFVPHDLETITGGILSICTIYKSIYELKNIHNCNVAASFLPNINSYGYQYSRFENDMVIFNFIEILKNFKELDFLEVHLPDYMIPLFKKNNLEYKKFYKWATKTKEFKINILNQNDLLMPDLVHVNDLKELSKNVSMTVAHEKYATSERRNYYNVPLHLFSPWLSPTPYVFKKFFEKENIIVLSPDNLDRVPNKCDVIKDEIVDKIKSKLPHYKIITIENMAYDIYKDIISKGKFTITFGEGLDGYFVESVFSGSVSFAVYNEYFFKPNFKDLPSVYDNFNVLFDKIIDDINYYDREENYTAYNLQLNNILTEIYSYERLKKNIEEYYKGNIDFK